MNTFQELEIARPIRSRTLRFAFICTTVSGVAKYRMGNFAWRMRRWPRVETVMWPYSHGCTVQNPWQVDMISREDVWRTVDNLCDKADVVVWQTLDFVHSWELWLEMKRRHQKPFLMEIDDYVTDIPVDHNAYDNYKGARHRIIMAQMQSSDGLICSTDWLAEQYADKNPRVFVVPNCIDFAEWTGLGSRRHDRLRIGWIGGGSHGKDLEMVAPVLEEVLSDYSDKDVWFYCIHGCPDVFKSWPRVYHTLRWANINLYPRFMASFKFDIGIAPLEDNNFNRAKSNLRWLEYSALGLPCVASPLPDFAKSIQHGQNGLLAGDLTAWRDALDYLIGSEAERRRIGDLARKTVKRYFNVNKGAKAYLDILRGFCG